MPMPAPNSGDYQNVTTTQLSSQACQPIIYNQYNSSSKQSHKLLRFQQDWFSQVWVREDFFFHSSWWLSWYSFPVQQNRLVTYVCKYQA